MHIDSIKDSEQPTSARALKESIRQSQANDTYLRLYLSFGIQLFESGWNINTAQNLLLSISNMASAQHALIAIESSGKLVVFTQLGQTLPVGSRVPMMGVLATCLKKPVHFAIHENKNTRLWTHADTNQHECLLPVAIGQSGKGIIALSGTKLTLGTAETESLQSIAGLLGLALLRQQNPLRSEIDRSILESLTPREREIFALLPSGLTNNELAAKLGIAAGTAKIHVERVLNKLGVKDRTQAAVKAVELGYKS